MLNPSAPATGKTQIISFDGPRGQAALCRDQHGRLSARHGKRCRAVSLGQALRFMARHVNADGHAFDAPELARLLRTAGRALSA